MTLTQLKQAVDAAVAKESHPETIIVRVTEFDRQKSLPELKAASGSVAATAGAVRTGGLSFIIKA